VPEYSALINSMGLNNAGAVQVLSNLMAPRLGRYVGISLGDHYAELAERFASVADYIVINVSCPNVAPKKAIKLFDLLTDVKKAALLTPVLYKISPDLLPRDYDGIAEAVLAAGIDGLIVSNTTTSRALCPDPHLGGLSGRPLKHQSTALVRLLYRLTEGKVTIIGVGGISSGRDAYDKICAGASLVQIYTSLVYRGHKVVNKITKELAEILVNRGQTIKSAIGSCV
jgi:dihydroorotate dehydrogenase